nr:RNA-dependent RNA polymerase [Phytophthora condilina negative stranded RNA virus 8]
MFKTQLNSKLLVLAVKRSSYEPSFLYDCDIDKIEKVKVYSHEDAFQSIKHALSFRMNIFDLGGSGDCFILCLSAGVYNLRMNGFQLKNYSVDDVYAKLNIPVNTYIEDQHIALLSNMFKVTIVVSTILGDNIYFQKFGDYQPIIIVHNDYPHHYYLYETLVLSNAAFTSIDPGLRGNPRELFRSNVESDDEGDDSDDSEGDEDEFESDSEDEDLTSDVLADIHVLATDTSESTIIPDVVQIYDDPHKDVIEDPDIKYLYHYVNTRYKIKELSKLITSSDSKAYYKLRHNVFKTTFMNLLSLPSSEEKPFTEYGYDSNRTPDFLANFGDFWLLIEFTVVKNYQSALKNKQSKTKYNPEILMMVQDGQTVNAFYPTLVLTEEGVTATSDITDIAKLIDLELVTDPTVTLMNLKEEINVLEYNISELIPELLLNDEISTNVNLKIDLMRTPEPFAVEKLKTGVKLQRNQNVFSRIRRSSVNLERQLKSIKYKGKFCIIINVKSNSIYVDSRTNGINKNTLLTLIQNLSDQVLNYTEVNGLPTSEGNPFTLFGDPSFEVSDSRLNCYDVRFDMGNYENTLYRKLASLNHSDFSKLGTLNSTPLSVQVETVESSYISMLTEKRCDPRIKIYNKNVFIFPIASTLREGKYEPLHIRTGLAITDMLFSRARSINRTELEMSREMNYDKLTENIKKQNKVHYRLKECGLSNSLIRSLKSCRNQVKWVSIAAANSFILTEEVKDLLKENTNLKVDMAKHVGEKTRTGYDNRISVTRSLYKSEWIKEMTHFDKAKGEIKICQDEEMHVLEAKFNTLLDYLFSDTGVEVSDNIYSNTEPVGLKFKDICTEMLDSVSEDARYLKRTSLMHNLLFVSRLCYTVLFLSNIKLNKEDFMYDNLGYEDVIVFVKGGKKILSNKKSRLFKLCFPIDSENSWLYQGTHNFTTVINNRTYIVLPWQTFGFDMLKKGCELYYSFSNYFISSRAESNMNIDLYKKFVSVKILNMFSQRRKIEVWFGSFRYLYLNSLSTHTQVSTLIKDMVDFDHDLYYYYIQRLFAKKYKLVYENAKNFKIFDILTDTVFENFDLCAEKFDESLFMTMAPFDRENEHLKNLRSVLETHKYYHDNFSMDPLVMLDQTTVDINDDGWKEDLFSNDFKFDPKMMMAIGQYSSNYLKRLVGKDVLSNEFTKIILSSYTDIATSRGMRQHEGEFWGKKGHDVLFSNQAMQLKVLEFLSNIPNNNREFQKQLEAFELSFKDKIESFDDIKLEFDMKDKKQWKGSREIYVMSDMTKVLQNPIERFFKFLCNFVPNELIHKQSHIRPKYIHSQVFEYNTAGDSVMYATLDCRKWAPRSNIWKYYYFVIGMQEFLPEEFVQYFLKIWNLMFKKRVRIQKRYVEILKKNKSTEHYVELLELREDGDYELTMPYSFLMGIFNYLSSILHAFTQLYFNDKVATRQGVDMNLIAHSDDSGGAIISSSYSKSLKVFGQYEVFQKLSNHLLSTKKSSLSGTFFEMISIMYAKQRLIPMTHKFLAHTSFEPKGNGWQDDISTVVSKVVELFSNGGSLLQCYLTMLSMGEMIRKFYHLPRLVNLSKIPLAFGGLFNMHPIHLILLGTDAQEIMLDLIETERERNFRINIYQAVTKNYFPGKGSTVRYKIPYYKRHASTLDLNEEQYEMINLTSACYPKTTLGKLLQHYGSLRNSNYVYSLMGVDMCQVFTYTLFSRTMILKYDDKTCDMRRFTRYYCTLLALGASSSEKIVFPLSNFANYMKSSESIRIKLSDISVRSQKTCKPVSYSTFQVLGLGMNYRTINELVAYNSPLKTDFLFNDIERVRLLDKWVKSSLPGDETTKLEMLQKMTAKDNERVRSSYCFLPSGISVDTIERFWTYMNFYCTRRYYISSKKPQYFTLDQFKLWNKNYGSLKHYYLLQKVMLTADIITDDKFQLLKENAMCENCDHSRQAVNMLDEMKRLLSLQEYEKTETNLPFALYHTPQRRNVNVWYGSSEFTIYTVFGSIGYKKGDAGFSLAANVIQDGVLDQMYFLLTNFIQSRGMIEFYPAYDINDSSEIKIGFTDLNEPILAHPGFRGMIIRNSVVRISVLSRMPIVKEDGKLKCMGSNVEFEIYKNYDVNPDFYRKHRLGDIRDLIFDKEYNVNIEKMKAAALSSKAYKILFSDPQQGNATNLVSDYKHGGLLGSERSFTRALVLADNEGVTSFRSSVSNIKKQDSVLEGISFKDIPVIDLISLCNFARLTWKERKVLFNIANTASFLEKDTATLERLTLKLGLKPVASALVTFKVIFSSLSYNEVGSIKIDVLEDFMYTMIKSALNSMEDKPRKLRTKLQDSISSIASKIYLMFQDKRDFNSMAIFLADMFNRAHSDSPGIFWDNRKSNVYSAIYTPSNDYYEQQVIFLSSVLNHINQKGSFQSLYTIRQIINSGKNLQKNKSLMRTLKMQRESDIEFVTNTPMYNKVELNNFYLDAEDEDALEDGFDQICNNDEVDEYLEREWPEDGKNAKFFICNRSDLRYMMEKSLKKDYASVTIYSIFEPENYPWLGFCDIFSSKLRGQDMTWHVSEYPGSSRPRMRPFDHDVPQLTRKEFKELKGKKADLKSKILDTKVEDSIFDLKSDDEIYDYQVGVLNNLGINNTTPFERYFFRRSDIANKEGFWNSFFTKLNMDMLAKSKDITVTRRMRTAVLPGFTGNLRDAMLKAELSSFFNDHVEEVVSGNHRITSSLYKNLLFSIRRVYQNTNDNYRALLTIFLSMMKDCIIDDVSDDWFTDPILDVLNDIEDDLSRGDPLLYAPKPQSANIVYETTEVYEDSDLE